MSVYPKIGTVSTVPQINAPLWGEPTPELNFAPVVASVRSWASSVWSAFDQALHPSEFPGSWDIVTEHNPDISRKEN